MLFYRTVSLGSFFFLVLFGSLFANSVFTGLVQAETINNSIFSSGYRLRITEANNDQFLTLTNSPYACYGFGNNSRLGYLYSQRIRERRKYTSVKMWAELSLNRLKSRINVESRRRNKNHKYLRRLLSFQQLYLQLLSICQERTIETPIPSPSPTSTPPATPSPTPTATSTPTATPTPTVTPTPTPSPTPTSTPSPTPSATPSYPTGNNVSLDGYRIGHENDPWHIDISNAPVDPYSAEMMKTIDFPCYPYINNNDPQFRCGSPDKPHTYDPNRHSYLKADFGTVYNGKPNGIQYTVVGPNQPKVNVELTSYKSESDPVGNPGQLYPIPADAAIEGGQDCDPNESDCHVLVLDRSNDKLYELYGAKFLGLATNGLPRWTAKSGAIFDLKRVFYGQRPLCWTSSDAAGLAVLPGLVRYDEVLSGEIKHALRVTLPAPRQAAVVPASHFAGHWPEKTYPYHVPYGARIRLKASFDIEGKPYGFSFSPETKVILRALKKYGMMVSDITGVGGSMFITGVPDPRWNDNHLSWMKYIKSDQFEIVQTDLFGRPRLAGSGSDRDASDGVIQCP